MINSLSIDDIFWGEIKDGRLSFRTKDMPESVHFTLSWANPANINFHITRNTGDGTDKPQIKIASWNKDLVDKFIPFIPRLIFENFYKPVSFTQYSRKERKNIRLIFFDALENDPSFKRIEGDVETVFKKHSSIKRKTRVKLNTSIEKELIHVFTSTPLRDAWLSNLRSLGVKVFQSEISRCGVIFIGTSKSHFLTHKNKCYILKKKETIQNLLKTFMKPELVEGLLAKINNALTQIQTAKSFEDTLPYNTPFKLYIEQ